MCFTHEGYHLDDRPFELKNKHKNFLYKFFGKVNFFDDKTPYHDIQKK